MTKAAWAALSLACGLAATACISVGSTGDDTSGSGSVSIDSLSVTPTKVGDGETFDVAWQVSHTTKAGYVTDMGLYLGTEAELSTASARDSRSFFKVAVTAGAANDASTSSISCTRTGTLVKCGTTNGSRDVAGETNFTFRACTSYALSNGEGCAFQPVSLSFP